MCWVYSRLRICIQGFNSIKPKDYEFVVQFVQKFCYKSENPTSLSSVVWKLKVVVVENGFYLDPGRLHRTMIFNMIIMADDNMLSFMENPKSVELTVWEPIWIRKEEEFYNSFITNNHKEIVILSFIETNIYWYQDCIPSITQPDLIPLRKQSRYQQFKTL